MRTDPRDAGTSGGVTDYEGVDMRKNTYWEADETRPCYFCGLPSVYEASVELDGTPHVERPTLEEIFDSMKRGEVLPCESRGHFRITADACAAHEDHLIEALEDTTGHGVAGRSLGKSTCPDEFHSRSNEDAYETEPQYIGNGWNETHYRCPTCGFETFSKVMVPNDIVATDAYKFAARAIVGSKDTVR